MKTVVLSLGGSLIVPSTPDTAFLKQFRDLILEFTRENRAIIVCGGGMLARRYNSAQHEMGITKTEEKDWVGIMATRINAELVRTMFGEDAYKTAIYDPTIKIPTNKKIIVAAGFKPGCSTDYDAVLLAKTYDSLQVINLTNVDYVYDKNPSEFKDAKPYEKLTWDEIRKIVGSEWSAGMNAPFDPVACKEAARSGIKVIIVRGTKLMNLRECLSGRKFLGTVIG